MASDLVIQGGAAAVHWLTEDLLTWQPARTWRVWHDRAVYHFLTIAAEQDQYRQALEAGTQPGSVGVLGCFAPDGRCQHREIRLRHLHPDQGVCAPCAASLHGGGQPVPPNRGRIWRRHGPRAWRRDR